MKTAYAVEYIEAEFGERKEGYALYLDREEMIRETREKSKSGCYPDGAGFYGPELSPCYHEVSLEYIKESIGAKRWRKLKREGKFFTDRDWALKFEGPRQTI